ncbi:Glucosamine-6-phosphate isomerase [Candida viswanathii]|uniref:glucosamine-6-phosphate deaminase n=1 Tax=Candida viswanathii TaxID=5486 RepID=A0A367YEF9_9ASCO|nr:Glucosamine-6-phosphate isomerase [Candida viswanathii]
MRQATFSNPEDASEYLANYIIHKINTTTSSPFVLGLPTGSSPEGIYARLIKANKEGRVSFKNVVTFNMDDTWAWLLRTCSPTTTSFLQPRRHPPRNINILNGLAADVEKECADYEAKIKKYGRINLFLGGLGPEGHLAFNEAGSSRDSITRKVDLVESTIKANSRFFGNDEARCQSTP